MQRMEGVKRGAHPGQDHADESAPGQPARQGPERGRDFERSRRFLQRARLVEEVRDVTTFHDSRADYFFLSCILHKEEGSNDNIRLRKRFLHGSANHSVAGPRFFEPPRLKP